VNVHLDEAVREARKQEIQLTRRRRHVGAADDKQPARARRLGAPRGEVAAEDARERRSTADNHFRAFGLGLPQPGGDRFEVGQCLRVGNDSRWTALELQQRLADTLGPNLAAVLAPKEPT
jgi:hypothetical protein